MRIPKIFKSDEERKSFIFLESKLNDLFIQYEHNFGNVIDNDKAKELFAKAGYNGLNSEHFHEASSQLTEYIYKKYLTTKKKRNNNKILFIVGTPGSGKTTTAETLIHSQIKHYNIIFDGVFSYKNSIFKKIDTAILKGYEVTLTYIYRNPEKAWVGVLNRTVKTRRIVSLNYFIYVITIYQNLINRIIKKYRNHIKIIIIENNGKVGEAKIKSIEDLSNYPYYFNENTLRILVEKVYNDGKITKEQKEKILG